LIQKLAVNIRVFGETNRALLVPGFCLKQKARAESAGYSQSKFANKSNSKFLGSYPPAHSIIISMRKVWGVHTNGAATHLGLTY